MSEYLDRKTILVVDDAIDNIEILASILGSTYNINVALNGEDAINIANTYPQPDLILLDVMMPVMDGFEVCKRLKTDKNTSKIQIVFVTGTTEQETVAKGLECGAYYYLTKPVDPVTIEAVVKSAINENLVYQSLREELVQTENTLSMLKVGLFRFSNLEEARRLAIFLAKVCPESDKRVTGLTELLINAVEHGNLGISYDEKSELMAKNEWSNEVEKRLTLPEYAKKEVVVTFEKNEDEIRFIIRDQGRGFEWERYLQIETSRMTHTHGRGIAMANLMSLDDIQYQGIGNEVIAVVKL